MNKLFVLFLLLLSNFGFTQIFERYNVPFVKNGNVLDFPLTGGLNAPQISGVDLNHDGMTDLFINDRIGGVPLSFVFDPSADSKYRFEPGLTRYFPKTTNWALMLDFNKDNIPDLFTYSVASGIDGVTAYRGKWVSDTLHFDLVHSTGGPSNLIIPFSLANGTKTNLYVTPIDIPAFEDMDHDGDLDILSFDSGGGFINYYRNNSIEKGFKSDSLLFTISDQCWGKVFEGLSSTIAMSADPDQCSLGLLGGGMTSRHVGSTLLALDLDGDNDEDMLVGDVSYGKITGLFNNGNNQKAWVTSQDTAYPKYNVPVNYPEFPASYKADIGADGKLDLIFSPNSTGITEDRSVFQVYNPESAGFNQMQKSNSPFLVNEMLDLGSGTHPTFMDIDNDGDQDMIVGNFNYFTNITERNGRLYLFLNIGNTSQPSFELTDSDYLGFSVYSKENWGFAPSAGDLDGDGDVDLMVGSEDGTLYYAENIAGQGNEPIFASVVTKYKGIDVGQASTPFIFDVDEDGLNDLVIGERNGNVNYLPNIGTTNLPDFAADVDKSPNFNFFGKIDTRESGFASGNSSPIMLKIKGKLHLISGALNGNIHFYKDIENNFAGKFTLITKNLGNIKEGERVKPVLVKLYQGENYEMVVGNMRGGLGIFDTNLPSKTTGTDNLLETSIFKIYPNPAGNYIKIQDEENSYHALDLNIYDQIGRLIKSQNIVVNSEMIQIDDLASGMYFIELKSGIERKTFKILKQ